MRKSQQGFGAIELILILALVGIVGFVGWRVYQANQQIVQQQQEAVGTASSVSRISVPSVVPAAEKTEDLSIIEKSLDTVDVEGTDSSELDYQLNY